jgi:hypothetical protein
MRVRKKLAWLGLCTCAYGISIGSIKKTLENLHTIPEGWEEAGTPDAKTKLQFRIVLAPVSRISRSSYLP